MLAFETIVFIQREWLYLKVIEKIVGELTFKKYGISYFMIIHYVEFILEVTS